MSYRSGQDPEENLPDWLKDLRKRQSQETSQPGNDEAKPSSEESDEEPDWLREIRERYGRPEAKPEEALGGTSLSDTQPIPASRAVEAELEPRQLEPEEQAFIEESVSAESPLEHPEIPEPQAEASRREFPEWLEEPGEPEEAVKKEEKPTAPHIPAFAEGTGEELTPGELPSWLQALRPEGIFPQEDRRSSEMVPGAQETAGPLAGLSDVLPAEPEAIQSLKPPVYSARLELTDSQSQHVAAFRKLLEEEGQPKEDLSRRAALPARLLSTITGIALLMAVAIPLVNQSQLAPRPEAEMLPESAEVFNIIELLPADAPVLITFDLQPALYGETSPAISAVFAHLLDRQARLVFISTQPTGPALAETLLHKELAELPAVATGGYTNLGYLSGGMVALRSFLNDPRSATFSATALGLNPWAGSDLELIDSVSDFALVLVISSNAEDARIWIEQGAAELPNGLVAVTSAQAGPLLRPYLQSQPRTLRGMVSGLQGAVIYERLAAQDGAGRLMWDAYSFGLGAIVLLILLGGLYGRLIHMRAERPAESGPQKQPTAGNQNAV